MRLPMGAVAALLALLACCARDVLSAPIGSAFPPPSFTCSAPEPAWQTSSWWPAGALFRCGCGWVSGGTSRAWNDVAICAALGDLLFATGGPQPDHMAVQQTVQPYIFYWSRLGGWSDAAANVSTDYCSFDMVICGVSNTGVSSAMGYGLSMSNANLTGTVPPSFGSLAALADINALDLSALPDLTMDLDILVPFAPSLTSLSLTGTNVARGTLPPSLGSLTMMRMLQIAAKTVALTGTLPAELGSLTRLQSLQLSNNAFTGGIPDSWASLTALTSVYMNGNSLSGTLSGTTLCAMKALVILDLSENSFSGSIPSLGSCTPALQFAYLDLKSNAFTGARPSPDLHACTR